MRVNYQDGVIEIEATELDCEIFARAQQLLEPLTRVPTSCQKVATDTKEGLTTILAFLRPQDKELLDATVGTQEQME